MLKDLDGAYRRGARVLGLYGPGGLGKTILSTQVAERAFRHFDLDLQVERALWLDLRATEGLFGALVEQLCDIVQASGDPVTAQALRTDPDPRPLALVQALVKSLGRRCLIVLDNSETLLDGEGRVRPGPEAQLVNALACHSGWPCLLTSRERFSLGEGGREPCPIEWRRVPELLYSERTALLRAALERSRLRFEQLEPELQRLIVEEVAGHPYELNLFLGEARNDMDLRAILREVHERTGEYARLDYYVGRAPAQTLPVLHLLAALDEPTERTVLEMAWSFLAAEHGWHLPPERFGTALVDLAGRGLAEEQEAGFSVVPVLRSFLIESDSAPAIAPEALEAMHRDLARFFSAVSNSVAEEAKKRLAMTGDPGSHAALVGLSQLEFNLLHRALRHALEQSDVVLIAAMLEKFVRKAGGRVAQTRITAYARGLRRRLDGLAETDPPQGVIENVGAAYGVVGDAHAGVRDWPTALESYQRCLAWLQKAGQQHKIGYMHHQVGMVYQKQRDWPAALESCQQALEWKKKTGQEHEIGTTYHQVGIVHQEQRDWPRALESYQQALMWCEKTGQHRGIGRAYHQLGMVYQEQLDWLRALESYQQALAWMRRTGQQHEIGLTYHQVGITYQLQHDWPKAIESYQQALAWKEKTGQHSEIGSTYHQMGTVYQDQRDWPKALESYQRALAWKEKTDQDHAIGATYHQVGMVYQLQRDWPRALESYQQALAWDEKTGQHHQIGSTLAKMGLLYEGQEDHGAAAWHYKEALECFLTRGYSDPQHIVLTMRLLKQRFAEATQEDLTPVRQRFERLLAEHPELRELSERLDREREGEA